MIDYFKIARALEHYKECGYIQLDVPWTVPKGVMTVTTPDRVNLDNCRYLDKYLIGSAEQSFIEMIERNTLPFDKCCAVTPCFRDDEEDKYQQKYFMKLELIHYQHPRSREYRSWLARCLKMQNHPLLQIALVHHHKNHKQN